MNKITGPLSAGLLLSLGCNSGQPRCHDCGSGDDDAPQANLEVRCEPIDTWFDGELSEILATDNGLIVGGGRVLAEGMGPDPWMAHVGTGGGTDWKLTLPAPGPIFAIANAPQGYYVLQRQLPTGTQLHTVEPAGNLTATVDLPLIEGVPPLGSALLPVGDHALVGGTVGGDLWLGMVDMEGGADTILLEDHMGFADSVDHLLRLPAGYVAVASVGTTPGTINGDISVAEAVDTVLIFFDGDLVERARATVSDDDPYVSTVSTALALADDGSIVLVGYRVPTLEAGERKAWAARFMGVERSWLVDWRGPAPSDMNYPLASLHAVGSVGDGMVVVGGRQISGGGSSRWHSLIDVATGEVVVSELGDVAKTFDSYLAGTNEGALWFAGTSKAAESEQWVCGFEIVG